MEQNPQRRFHHNDLDESNVVERSLCSPVDGANIKNRAIQKNEDDDNFARGELQSSIDAKNFREHLRVFLRTNRQHSSATTSLSFQRSTYGIRVQPR